MPTICRVVKQISVSDKAGMPIEGEICELSAKLGWFQFQQIKDKSENFSCS